MYRIYTDGSTKTNPGPGGYAYRIYKDGSVISEGSQGYYYTTNNRMEVMAALVAIESLPSNSDIELVSDSMYVVDSFNFYCENWVKSDFTTCKNPDLWKKMYALKAKHNSIKFIWEKGHAGEENNEWCDKEAKSSHNKENLLEDLDGTDYYRRLKEKERKKRVQKFMKQIKKIKK